jgi:hypothetical protein
MVELADLHPLVLRGALEVLDADAGSLEAAGLVLGSGVGWMLTPEGLARHAELLEAERATLDLEQLGGIYERFHAANGPFKALSARWQSADEDTRWALAGELADLVERVSPALRRTAAMVPRFGRYDERLRAASARVEAGDFAYVTSPSVESLHTIWMELHEDYLQTLGRSREDEGSY